MRIQIIQWCGSFRTLWRERNAYGNTASILLEQIKTYSYSDINANGKYGILDIEPA